MSASSTTESRPPPKSLARRLITLAVFVIWIGLSVSILLELGIRLLHLVPDNAPIQYDAIGGEESFSPKPGSHGHSLYGVLNEINSLGLRDRERPIEKAPGTIRVVVVGDSVTYAHGVPQEQSFCAQLETLLRARGRSYEVWNLGVEAYDSFNENARYERLAPAIKPDQTILMVMFNDLLPGPTDFRVTSAGTLSARGRKAPYPDSWRPFLESSALFTKVMRVYGSMGDNPSTWDPWKYYPAMELQLDRFLATSNRLGSRVIIGLMSGLSPSGADYRALAARLHGYAARKGVTFIGLGEVLGDNGSSALFLPGDSVHPNIEGHTKIARALAPLVQ